MRVLISAEQIHHRLSELARQIAPVYQDRPLDEMWQRLGADPGLLPPVRPAGTVLGTVHAAAAASTGLRPGTPVAVTVPDSMAALLGSGAWRVGSTLILAGSTMPVLASADRPRADPTRRTWTGRHPIAGLGVNESNAGTTAGLARQSTVVSWHAAHTRCCGSLAS